MLRMSVILAQPSYRRRSIRPKVYGMNEFHFSLFGSPKAGVAVPQRSDKVKVRCKWSSCKADKKISLQLPGFLITHSLDLLTRYPTVRLEGCRTAIMPSRIASYKRCV